MTRVNAGVHAYGLHRRHLVAELREITMVPAALRRSLRTRTPEAIMASIPKQFTLNAGHVKFFFNKLEYLKDRFNLLADEMERRGYKADRSRAVAFDGFDEMWYGNWVATQRDAQIILDRIKEKKLQKPHLYA